MHAYLPFVKYSERKPTSSPIVAATMCARDMGGGPNFIRGPPNFYEIRAGGPQFHGDPMTPDVQIDKI